MKRMNRTLQEMKRRWKKCSYEKCRNRHPAPTSDSAIDLGWSSLEFDMTQNGKRKKFNLYACPEHSKHLVKMMKNTMAGNPVTELDYPEPLQDWLVVAAGGRK